MATPSSSIELTVRGRVVAWLAALAAGAAWIGGEGTARLAAAMLAAPIVLDFVLKQRGLHHTSIRTAPRRTVAGAVFTETLHVEHRGRRPLRECLLAEPRSMRHEPPVLLPPLPPFRPARVDVRQRCMQRSHVLERVFVLVSYWPLGIFRSRSVVATAADLVTEPARVRLAPELLDAAADEEVAPYDRSRLPGPEFLALREHLADEDSRGVHALRSAALGTLVRRVTRGRLPRTIGVVLDLRRPPWRGSGRGAARAEWSLGACATLVEALRARGAEVRVVVLAGEPARIDVRGPAQLAELLTLLSEAGVAAHRTLPGDLLADVAALVQCFWIAAGGYSNPPEARTLAAPVTMVAGDDS